MPRRRIGTTSISAEESSFNQSESLNLSDDLPDPGLPQANSKDGKEKKRVSFNFPVEVITKDGKYSGMGTINLMECSKSDEDDTALSSKCKQSVKETICDLTQDEEDPEVIKKQPLRNQKLNQEPSKDLDPPKNKEIQRNEKNQEPLVEKVPVSVDKASQLNKKHAAKEAQEAKNKEIEARKEAIKKRVEEQKQAIKKRIEEQKQAVAEFEEIDRIFKPGESLKYVNIEVHPTLASMWFMKEVKREAATLGVRFIEAEDICDPGLLMWTRYVPPTLANEGGQMKLSSNKKQCDQSMYIITAEEMLPKIADDTVTEFVALKQELIGGKITLALFGFQNVVNGLASSGTSEMSQQKFAKRISDVHHELLVEKRVELVGVNDAGDLACLVGMHTRAIADAPYKKSKDDIDGQAEFYMRGDNKNCVTVDKDGNGLSRLWEQMIAVLPMSSLEVARSLGSEYKSPLALSQELQTKGGIDKIADIGVTRTNVPGAKSRRLGKEFARKLHILFTTEDGNTVIE